MTAESFVLGLAIIFTLLMIWACKTLPGERWQMLAAVPVAKDADGRWRGINLTYYGLLTANAAVTSVALLFVLLTALGAPLGATVAIVVVEMALCMPAAKLVARIVEKKACTFTIAGAFFVGVVTVPWAISLVNWSVSGISGSPIPVTAAFAAIAIIYAFGEGLGRLACISFGCCYGKPVSQLPQAIQRVFNHWHFVFFGQTKKIAYASDLEGERVLPIQAVTSVLYLCTGLATTLLFLRAFYATALVLSLTVTQGWRVVSESFRADYRGNGTISAYQWMGFLSIPYMLAVVFFFPAPPSAKPNILAGLCALWDPAVVLFLQGLWAALFVFFGKSMVTGSAISFHVHHDRI
jgi:prolipoprotein diacylglyceryltransferase